MRPKVSVAIPTMGRDTVQHTLKSIERQTVPPYEVLVVNQGPKDLEQRTNFDLPVNFLHQDARGLSRARNRALETFTGDWVLFTDDDQQVNAEWVEQLQNLAIAYPEVAMIGGAVFPPPRYDANAEFVSQMYVLGEVVIDQDSYLAPSSIPFVRNDIWGGNFALSRSCIEKVGLYDEAFGRGSGMFDVGEDTDYTMRVFSSGLKGLLSCRLIIYHTYGARPHSDQMTTDTVEVAAAMAWKAKQNSSIVAPELAARLRPFGAKRLAVGKLTGGAVFGDQAARHRVYTHTLERLDRDFALRSDGRLESKV